MKSSTRPETLFRLVAESLPSGILVVDSEGIITLASEQIELQFGYTRGELISQSIDVLLPESLRAVQAACREGSMTKPVARAVSAAVSFSAGGGTALSFRSTLN